jgi:hypothetical protein
MTKEEMLRKTGLTDQEYRELVHRFQHLLASLNPAQRAAVERWMPSATQIVRSFGSDLNTEQLAGIVEADPTSTTSISERGIGLSAPNPNPNP